MAVSPPPCSALRSDNAKCCRPLRPRSPKSKKSCCSNEEDGAEAATEAGAEEAPVAEAAEAAEKAAFCAHTEAHLLAQAMVDEIICTEWKLADGNVPRDYVLNWAYNLIPVRRPPMLIPRRPTSRPPGVGNVSRN
jgi:hypothetical protein